MRTFSRYYSTGRSEYLQIVENLRLSFGNTKCIDVRWRPGAPWFKLWRQISQVQKFEQQTSSVSRTDTKGDIIADFLGVDVNTGLSDEEAALRLKRFGPNAFADR